MNEISEKIELFLKKYSLNKSNLIYLCAFSGGFDSMCLLDSLKKLTSNIVIAIHLNHGWRGEESDREEKNCQNFCEKIGVEFYSERLDENIPHTETAAREARYEFFENCAKKFNSRIVFTAHNKNDNAETLIYRICKGTGISGLQGIAAHRGIYYRPLLDVSRAEIEKYCQNHHLNPNFDSSNNDTKYKRNFIRTKVMPALCEVNPHIIDTVNTLSTVAKEETEIVEEYLKLILDKITHDGKIKTTKFLAQTDAVQKRIIYKIFIDNNLDYTREKILKIQEFIKENSILKSGKTCSLTTDLWIFTSDKFIAVINSNKTAPLSLNILKAGRYETEQYIFELDEFTKDVKKFPEDTDNTAYVDLSKIEINFELRTREDGDYIQPFGMQGSQKLKKYLNEKKIPNHEKDNLLFLAQDKEILWAINLGISEKIKVTDKPTHRIKFYKKEGA